VSFNAASFFVDRHVAEGHGARLAFRHPGERSPALKSPSASTAPARRWHGRCLGRDPRSRHAAIVVSRHPAANDRLKATREKFFGDLPQEKGPTSVG